MKKSVLPFLQRNSVLEKYEIVKRIFMEILVQRLFEILKEKQCLSTIS